MSLPDFRARLALALAPRLTVTTAPPAWEPSAPPTVRRVGSVVRSEQLSDTVTLHLGDSRDVVLAGLDPVQSIVTDPPYALVSIVKRFGKPGSAAARVGATGAYARASAGFMGQTWDTGETAFDPEFWADVMALLVPGGHILAASGTRTYHRLACAAEDAGFEIRDMVSWLYGSGFPKSHDVSKGIDAAAGAVREVISERETGWTGTLGGKGTLGGLGDAPDVRRVTAPATDAAREWAGWGTALKPACEPWVMGRKPLIGTVAQNVQTHRTGALNIDACRVNSGPVEIHKRTDTMTDASSMAGVSTGSTGTGEFRDGRWPANVAHDGSDAVLAGFPDAKGPQGDLKGHARGRQSPNGVFGAMGAAHDHLARVDLDTSAARFFYCAKASKADREEGMQGAIAVTTGDGRSKPADNAYQRGKTERLNSHPTVKPEGFMRWACRLVTPPGGVVLDPFMGSGSTGKAAVREGFGFVGIERDPAYYEIALRRVAYALRNP